MEEFPPFCAHYKSLGHSKVDFRILHPHLDDVPVIILDPMTDVNMVTNNLVPNGCSDVVVQDTVKNLYTTAVNPIWTHVGDVIGPFDTFDTLVIKGSINAMAEPVAPSTIISSIVENALDSFNVMFDSLLMVSGI
ncbi:hypothetical protein IEQ34_010968 [Dendrobium chrysotoxum]|uniref:Uncharacterized protein n=1 Tax=Dendrobium chrysotoxum TaxID=161865 RepID=A0AAV7GEU3_DENCH|nr:hypothetical protein IEQ34_010968 [Dendrobium chrysotoxum]